MLTSMDKVFYKYGVKCFGEPAMKELPDSAVEEARVFAAQGIHDLTAMYGKQ